MKSWSLNRKISFVIAIFVVAASVISFIGLDKMSSINEALNRLVAVNVKRLSIAKDLRDIQRRLTVAEKNYILEPTKEGMDSYGQEIQKLHTEMTQSVDSFKKLADSDGQRLADEFMQRFEAWYKISEETQRLAYDNQNQAAFALSRGKGREARVIMEESIDQLVDLNTKKMDAESAATDATYAAARTMVLTISLASIFAGIALAFFIMRAVSRAIDQVITNLDDNSNQVTSASQQIAASSEQLSQAATEQAASLVQTASAIEELSSMVQRNADNAQQSAALSNTSSQSASKGKEVVQNMIQAIDGISASNNDIMVQINASNHQISEIVTVIGEIAEKTKVINDIVFQTKLLSFNASVEAARAGEHGKGFAVVAEEVGNLAQMSGNAAKEISEMLESSIHKVESIVNETKSKVETLISAGKQSVESGIDVARQCGDVLDEIVGSVTKVSEMVMEIAAASREQAQGVQEITKAMNQLDQVTQENASTSEEAASAAEELSAQADSLRGVVGLLVETIRGENGAQASNSARAPAHFKSPPKAKTSEGAKVFQLSRSTPAAAVKAPANTGAKAAAPLQKAAGAEAEVPSADDPRFNDV